MPIANTDQAEHWNSSDDVGHWVRAQEQYDGFLDPFNEVILDAAAITPADRVLDVGCGCGATSRAAARRASAGHVHGIDLSRDMLARGREEAAAAGLTNVTFEEADAQVHELAAGAYDAVISRFGVMFFSDPTAAFANLRRAAAPGGRLAFVCWQPFADNEWLRVTSGALGEHLPAPQMAPPGTPGMMAFADPERPRRALADAGWNDVIAEPRAVDILIGGPGTVDAAMEFVKGGSIGRGMLTGADPETQARALASLRDAFTAHLTDEGVRLGAAVWLVTARN